MKDWKVMETGTIQGLLKEQIRCEIVTGVYIDEIGKVLHVERPEKMTHDLPISMARVEGSEEENNPPVLNVTPVTIDPYFTTQRLS